MTAAVQQVAVGRRGVALCAPLVVGGALYGVAVGAASLLLTLLLATRFSGAPVGGDALVYARMAHQPWVFTQSPWGYRLLTPWLVHLLPLPIDLGFWLITVLALAATATVLALY